MASLLIVPTHGSRVTWSLWLCGFAIAFPKNCKQGHVQAPVGTLPLGLSSLCPLWSSSHQSRPQSHHLWPRLANAVEPRTPHLHGFQLRSPSTNQVQTRPKRHLCNGTGARRWQGSKRVRTHLLSYSDWAGGVRILQSW